MLCGEVFSRMSIRDQHFLQQNKQNVLAKQHYVGAIWHSEWAEKQNGLPTGTKWGSGTIWNHQPVFLYTSSLYSRIAQACIPVYQGSIFLHTNSMYSSIQAASITGGGFDFITWTVFSILSLFEENMRWYRHYFCRLTFVININILLKLGREPI